MHICFLCNEYPPSPHGGVGSFTQTLGRALVAHGQKVTVIGLYSGPLREENDDGISVIRLPTTKIPRAGYLLNGMRLRRMLCLLHQKTPIDILEGSELSLSLIPSHFPSHKVIRMHGGHTYLSTMFGRKPYRLRSWLEHRSFRCADSLCAVSHFVADTTRVLLSLQHRKIEILYNPVDTTLFHPQRDSQEKDGLIAFVGTVMETKGVRQLILAMEQIISIVPNARLWIIGPDWRDPQLGRSFTEELLATTDSRILRHIEFKGRIEHIFLPRLLAEAQVCAFPSFMEAMALAVLEAMAMQKAVVCTQTGPGPEMIEDEVSGLLCDPYSPSSIAEKIIRLLNDEKLRSRLAQAARERAVNSFSIDHLVEANLEFYQRVVENGAR